MRDAEKKFSSGYDISLGYKREAFSLKSDVEIFLDVVVWWWSCFFVDVG